MRYLDIKMIELFQSAFLHMQCIIINILCVFSTMDTSLCVDEAQWSQWSQSYSIRELCLTQPHFHIYSAKITTTNKITIIFSINGRFKLISLCCSHSQQFPLTIKLVYTDNQVKLTIFVWQT